MRAGVQKPVVAMWRTRYADTTLPFPTPEAELHTGAVWLWPKVQSWLITTGRETDAGWTLEQVNASDIRQGKKPPQRKKVGA